MMTGFCLNMDQYSRANSGTADFSLRQPVRTREWRAICSVTLILGRAFTKRLIGRTIPLNPGSYSIGNGSGNMSRMCATL